jgi:hypothetical protein
MKIELKGYEEASSSELRRNLYYRGECKGKYKGKAKM